MWAILEHPQEECDVLALTLAHYDKVLCGPVGRKRASQSDPDRYSRSSFLVFYLILSVRPLLRLNPS